jgi:hypothetical protein
MLAGRFPPRALGSIRVRRTGARRGRAGEEQRPRQPGTEAAFIPRSTLPAEARSRAEMGKMVGDQEHAGAADLSTAAAQPIRARPAHETAVPEWIEGGEKSRGGFSISRTPWRGGCATLPSKTGARRYASRSSRPRIRNTPSVSSGSAEAPRDLAGSRGATCADPGARRACPPNRNSRDRVGARRAKTGVSRRSAAGRRLGLLPRWRGRSIPRSVEARLDVTSWPTTVPFRTTCGILGPEVRWPRPPKLQP